MDFSFFTCTFQKRMIFIIREKIINMKHLTNIVIAILLGLAISITTKNKTLQAELNELNDEEVRTEWIKAQVELNRENKNIIVEEDGNK